MSERSPDESPEKLRAGTVLNNKYRLVKPIGRGGMGVVWEARDTVGDRDVALKFVPRDVQRFDDEMKRVRKTFQTICALNHQYVCPLYALEKDSQFGYYLAMKRLHGTTLKAFRARIFDNRPIPSDVVPKFLRPVAEALDYAHRQGVVHCDVKPANIFLEVANGRVASVSLIDFGLASEIRECLTRVSQQQVGGTPRYMPPERWDGRRPNAKSDQYSLAVVAYELLGGGAPFVGADSEALRLAVLNETPKAIDGLSDSANAVLRKGLAKKRESRFHNCVAFVDALAAAIKNARHPKRKPRRANKPNAPASNDKSSESSAVFVGASAASSNKTDFIVPFQTDSSAESVFASIVSDSEYAVFYDDVLDVELLKEELARGDAETLFYIGERVLYGRGVGAQIDKKASIEFFRKAAKLGNALATNQLGECCRDGLGVKKDANLAAEYFLNAAKLGVYDARENLFQLILQKGESFAGDAQKFLVEQFTKEADAGDAASTRKLGECRLKGLGVEKDEEKARELFHKAAALGDFLAPRRLEVLDASKPEQESAPKRDAVALSPVESSGRPKTRNVGANGQRLAQTDAKSSTDDVQNELGERYRDDRDVKKSVGTAAKQESDAAQYRLAVCYRDGLGVEKSVAAALLLFRRAASRGKADALKAFVELLDREAKSGNADAQNDLGVCWRTGFGVARDFESAAELFRQAAKKGCVAARYNLAVCYRDGRGVEKNPALAFQWFYSAAVDDFAAAQYNLAVCFRDGFGVERDEVAADKWFRQAAQQGRVGEQNDVATAAFAEVAWSAPDDETPEPDVGNDFWKFLFTNAAVIFCIVVFIFIITTLFK